MLGTSSSFWVTRDPSPVTGFSDSMLYSLSLLRFRLWAFLGDWETRRLGD